MFILHHDFFVFMNTIWENKYFLLFFSAYVLVGVGNIEYERIGQGSKKWKDKAEEKGK